MKRIHMLFSVPLLLASLTPIAAVGHADAPASPSAFTWRPIGGVRTPPARDHHSAVWTGSDMIIWGGGGGGGADGPAALSTGWRYTPTTDTWTQVADTGAPSPRHDHAAIWTGTEMLIWGGMDGFGFKGDGAAYNPQTNTWRPLASAGAPSPRAHFVYAWTGRELIVWGGRNDPGALGDGARYNPTSDTWTAMATTGAPTPRIEAGGDWAGSTFFVWGGRDNQTVYGNGAAYTPATNRWSPMPATGAPAARYRHVVVSARGSGYLLVWGGCTGTPTQCTYTNSGARFKLSTSTWSPMATTGAPSPRTGFTATWMNRTLSVWGGWNGTTYLGDGARYAPATNTWQAMPSTSAPAPRRYHTAVFSGSEVLIWGGSGMLVYADGARLGTSWRPMSLGTVPDPRHGAPAVWTGSEMIFYGGETQYENQRSGARYNPATDSWTLITPSSLPNWLGPYALHTAVWTGTEMAIYGGYTDIANWDGAAYNPATNAWRHIPLYLPATPRELHTAVYTGGTSGKMLVFGGVALNQAWSDLISWDPNTNTWTTIDAPGAPSQRLDQSSVWTGTEMLIWSGLNFSDNSPVDCATYSHILDDGGAYNPTTNTWRTIAPAPIQGRIHNVAVWTGSEMVIWGGQGGCYADTWLNDGAAYNPTTNTWRTLTASPLSARSNAVGVWTTPGYGVFIWGGQTGRSSFTNDGSFYNPATNQWNLAGANTLLVPRGSPQAVFATSKVLIWGGWNHFDDFNDGASYGP